MQAEMDQFEGDGEWSWLGCLIVLGLLVAEIAVALWVLMELLR